MSQTLPRRYQMVLRIGFISFLIAAVGVALNFIGFAVNERSISVAGFGLCAVGVVAGFAVILYGWLRYGSQTMKDACARYVRKVL